MVDPEDDHMERQRKPKVQFTKNPVVRKVAAVVGVLGAIAVLVVKLVSILG